MLNSIKPNFHFLRALVYHFQLREKWLLAMGDTHTHKKKVKMKWGRKIYKLLYMEKRSVNVCEAVGQFFLSNPSYDIVYQQP